MNRDAVGAAENCQSSRGDRIGFLSLPCLTHGSNMVNINTQSNHASEINKHRARQ
jgi:hypothetical protein